MTYSIGFRAPSSQDLLLFFGEHAASTVLKPDDFYRDPDLQKQDNPGEASSIACSTPVIQCMNDFFLDLVCT